MIYEKKIMLFLEDLISNLEDLIPIISELLSLINNPFMDGIDGVDRDNIEPDEDDPGEDEPGEDGHGPGDSEPDGDDSDPQSDPNKDNKLDKGKGKAKAISPESIADQSEESIPEQSQEPYTDYDDKKFNEDIEKAKLNSLKEDTQGESSKQGAILEEREFFQEQQRIEAGYAEYEEACKTRSDKVREFNAIVDKLHKDNSDNPLPDRENLINESMKLRNAIDHYAEYIKSLKSELNITSEEEYNNYSSEENNSEEFESDNSPSEEERPPKRPKR